MQSRTHLVFLAAILGLSVVPSVNAQPSKCQTVQFSESVLERYPRAREACLDVITRDGEEYAVFKAELLRASGDTVRLRAKLPDGSYADSQSMRVDPDRRVLVDGKPVSPDELAVGQELTMYVHVTEPKVALAPADESVPLVTQPMEEAEPAQVAKAEEPAEMPATASAVPLVGAAGVLLLAIGAALGLLRRRAISRR